MEKLTVEQKRSILTRVQSLDPSGEIATLRPNDGLRAGSISYSRQSGLTLHENITRLTDEEYVRAYLVVRLAKQLKYPLDCLELEKGYTIGRPTGKSAQLDIRVLNQRDGKKRTFMLIEAKRPDEFESYPQLIEDQLFSTGKQEHANGVRYIVWYSLDFHLSEPRDKCIIIDFRKFTEYKDWVEAGELGHNLDLPAEYGVVRKTKYVKGKTDLRNDLTREELTRLQKDFHNVLWGGAKMGDTDVFNNLLKMFIAKIYDEQTTEEGKPYRFQSDLKDGSPETAHEILAKVNKIYQDALYHYFKYEPDVIKAAAINREKFKPEKVAYVVEKLEALSIIENRFDDDVLGTFFEAIVRTGFKQEKGQFFTHANIVRFILYALELDNWSIQLINGTSPRLPYIDDPACGSGTFLIEAMKIITHSVLGAQKDKLKQSRMVKDYVQEWFQPNASNKNIHNRWAREFVYGTEDNEDLAMGTKVNMILHGDGNANIEKLDGLADFREFHQDKPREKRVDSNHPYKFPRNEQFDLIVSNPPFSLKEEHRTIAIYSTRFAYAERKNSENLFIERWYQLLKEGGRLGVVLPDSVFDTNENLYIRMFLYRFFWIKAIVSLPQVTFQPYTPTKTSLLFAVKKTRKEVEEWDSSWRLAANDYGKIRRSSVVDFVIRNEQLRNALIEIANKTEVEWYPRTNLLAEATLPEATKNEIARACEKIPSLKARFEIADRNLEAFLNEKTLDKLNPGQAKDSLGRLLRGRVPTKAETLSLVAYLEVAYDDIVEAAALNYTEEPKGQNYCNAWWCFAEVTAKSSFDYDVFFAEADHVGYKRTTRHPEGILQPNDLFHQDENGQVIINTGKPTTILDHLRSKSVFSTQ